MTVLVKKTVAVDVDSALITEFARELQAARQDIKAFMLDAKSVRLEFPSGTEFTFKPEVKVNP